MIRLVDSSFACQRYKIVKKFGEEVGARTNAIERPKKKLIFTEPNLVDNSNHK